MSSSKHGVKDKAAYIIDLAENIYKNYNDNKPSEGIVVEVNWEANATYEPPKGK